MPAGTTAGTYGVTMTGSVSGLKAHATFTVGVAPQSPSPGPDDWATFGFNAQQTRTYPGSTTGFGTSALALKWQTTTAPVREIDSSTTVSNGVAYVGTVHGTLYAINVATGAVLWTFAAHGPIYGSPNIVNGVLYFGTVDLPNEGIVGNEVYALDASTGTQLWEDTLPNGGAWYAPTVNAGRVIVPMANKEGQSGGVVAYSATDGTQLWYDNLLEGVWSPASFDPTGTHLYLATGNPCTSVGNPSPGDGCSGSVLDIDPTSGSIRWSYRVPDLSGDDDCGTAPAYDSGMVFVGCKNGIEYAFNALTGAIVWQFNTGLSGDSGIFSSAAVSNGVVYFGAGDAKVHALSEATGVQLWSYATAGAVVGSPIVADGAVYVASSGGTLYALDLSGTLLASAALGGPTLASPSLTNGVLYQTVKTGAVDAFTVATHGSLLTPPTPPGGSPPAVTPPAVPPPAVAPAAPAVRTYVGMASTPAGRGYWIVDGQGDVVPEGDAVSHGSMSGKRLNAPISHMVATPDGGGYWMVAADGGIFTFGDARFYGSMGARHLNAPVVALEPTRDGRGYWLVASDGGIFAFGDASYYGSMGGRHLNEPVVGMAADPATGGYWEVATDGGIFSFHAPFFGSTGNVHLNKPINGMAATIDGAGYRFVASDGGIFDEGGARFYGSKGGFPLDAPVVGMATDPATGGYWLVASDGGVFSFNAPFEGSAA